MALREAAHLVSETRIEPMTKGHVRQVVQIENAVFPRPWSLGLFLSELALPRTRAYLVALSGSRVIGYGGIMLSGDDAHVTTLAVDPAHQGGGVGTSLMVSLVDEAIARGAGGITLEVRTGNEVARHIYERFGFEAVGIRKNYYIETGEDALIMWVRSIDSPDFEERLEEIRLGSFRRKRSEKSGEPT